MKTAKLCFSSEEEIKNYVNECENGYLDGVKAAFESSLQSGSSILTLSGPTCSGKTTTSLILDREFEKIGKTLHTVSIDDFYFDRDLLDARCKEKGIPLDYDSPSTIDFDLFGNAIEQIEKRGKVTLPSFDFKSGKRAGYYTIDSTDGDVFLFEGIQAVYPEFISHLSGHAYTPMFISVASKVAYGDEVFGQRILRFFRRLVRDLRERNTSAEKTFLIWDGVCKNEDENIFPNLTDSHIYIDSSMAYEVSVIKPFLVPLLCGIAEDSVYYEKAQKLLERLSGIPVIDEKYLPRESVFREFIG